MPRKTTLPLLVLLSLAPLPAFGHADDAPEQKAPPIHLPEIDGPKPWSDKPLLNDPSRFQIAIMTDRNGGHRPGVWMDAVRKLNMLRPEFVLSVGDLIEGYSENRKEVEAQWEEFLGFIDQMEMKFFFVAGNHDVTNPLMHELWHERFGPEWYSFDYKDVHFLCLCSEDTRHQYISEDQVAFACSDLEQHPDSRHTLVFLHKPLWTYAERDEAAGNPDSTNWRKIERLLADRPHTVFAGHIHHYVQFERNGGRKYYALATTGGGSQLRGNPHGEFDHVTWLTMEPSGPQVVNLRLDGILPPDVVTEESANEFRRFLTRTQVEVVPLLVDSEEGFLEGDLRVRLTNGFDEPVKLTGDISGLPLQGITVEPEKIDLLAAPNESKECNVRVRFNETMSFDRLSMALFTAQTLTKDRRLFAERQVPVVIDQLYDVPQMPDDFQPDGDLTEWGELQLSTPDRPLVLGAASDWKGGTDGSFRFATGHTQDRVCFAIRVADDTVVKGDRIKLHIDGRPAPTRRADQRMNRGTARIVCSAPAEDGRVAVKVFHGQPRWGEMLDGAKAAGKRTASGYDLELSLPAEWFDQAQHESWKDFRLTVVQDDIDEPGAEPCRILWRGTEGVGRVNTGYGYFAK